MLYKTDLQMHSDHLPMILGDAAARPKQVSATAQDGNHPALRAQEHRSCL